MTQKEKLKKYGFFGSQKLVNKWIITGISVIGCSLLIIAATDLFSHWPSFRQNRWEIGAIGGNLWLVTKMWLGHTAMVRDESSGEAEEALL